ncbi:GNAT family N-acetyltransferase [Amycolatopsis thermophila]|uniref:Ribosomal protein S18 acetylase RimI-like enzyme n=1 Tax=Amycolatopsis thermophila TaxID=206084 RepID=A0ABU0ENH9_9PSEU|nr:GNAT family N-acetyltransferase [Amycolatopsis thermophila]MDQ0376845.1 ribosomal protein S18 acetylase RimI-like enzyme [Amycolatopsis thermophila]
MSEISVRPARPEEFAAVGALTASAYLADGLISEDDDYVRELTDAARRAEHAELLVAVDEGGLLGSVTVVRAGTEYAEISREGELEFRMLATAPAARGRGVGEALTRAVLDRAREAGASAVVMSSLDAMTTAHRLYTRLGFSRIPDRDWEPLPGLWLRAFRLVF